MAVASDHALPQGFSKDVVGYCDPLSVRPGEVLGFKLSTWGTAAEGAPVELAIVRLVSGDSRPHGTGLIEEPLQADLPATVTVSHQPLITGSYGVVQGLPTLEAGTVELKLFPTLLRAERCTVFTMGAVTVSISADGFYLVWAGGDLFIQTSVQLRRWYHLSVTFGHGSVHLAVQKLPGGAAEPAGNWQARAAGELVLEGNLIFAARAPGDAHFNGRLEAPSITGGDAVVAAWDFSRAVDSARLVDTSGHDHHGTLYQTPTRAVAGATWDGTVQSYHVDPSHYGAVHFHEDDLTDAGWTDSITWQVPDDLPSGQYALRARLQGAVDDWAANADGNGEDYIPFFVRARPGKPGAALAYLVPTASYLAYANQRLGFSDTVFGDPRLRNANDAFLYAHEDAGYSMYEYHRDHSGVHFSSRLRPVLNLKPKTGTWAFNADTHITAWLDAIDEPFDVVTDEDLHLEGAAALAPYRTVITGTHPEYYSTEMREGLSDWLTTGGRLMYMGGNGFYWRVAFDPANAAIMEVRRAEDGTRAWIANPGEYYHQFSGEYGGLWRRLGKPPNELVGIGFAAQGFDGGTYFRVQPGALDPRVAFAVEGIDAGELWGQFGNQGGGAAGEEIDRYDERLGSPAHAIVLATSENHRPGMLRVKEEFHMTVPLGNDPEVRADIVFFEVPGGGAVFSTGSISYAGSLAHAGYDNEIARLTGNVLRRFLDPQPFELPPQA